MFMVNLANLSELIIFFSPEIVGFHAGCPLKGYIIKRFTEILFSFYIFSGAFL